jgi:hypothetical protein
MNTPQDKITRIVDLTTVDLHLRKTLTNEIIDRHVRANAAHLANVDGIYCTEEEVLQAIDRFYIVNTEHGRKLAVRAQYAVAEK